MVIGGVQRMRINSALWGCNRDGTDGSKDRREAQG